jgi:hypothetical protein
MRLDEWSAWQFRPRHASSTEKKGRTPGLHRRIDDRFKVIAIGVDDECGKAVWSVVEPTALR